MNNDNYETNLVYATQMLTDIDENVNIMNICNKLRDWVREFSEWEEKNIYCVYENGWEEYETDYESVLYNFVFKKYHEH